MGEVTGGQFAAIGKAMTRHVKRSRTFCGARMSFVNSTCGDAANGIDQCVNGADVNRSND